MSRKSAFRWVPFAVVGAALLLVFGWMTWVASIRKAVFYASEKAKGARTQALLTVAGTASRNYYIEYEKWPSSLADLTNNPRQMLFIQWLATGTRDGWGNPIIYSHFDRTRGYGSVSSYGRDGKPGGEGEDKDTEIHFDEKGIE
jgi:general secretion pathway protein G